MLKDGAKVAGIDSVGEGERGFGGLGEYWNGLHQVLVDASGMLQGTWVPRYGPCDLAMAASTSGRRTQSVVWQRICDKYVFSCCACGEPSGVVIRGSVSEKYLYVWLLTPISISRIRLPVLFSSATQHGYWYLGMALCVCTAESVWLVWQL